MYVQGLADPHVHLIQGGLSLSQLELADIGSKEEFVHAVARVCGVPGLCNPVLCLRPPRLSHEHDWCHE